MPEAFLCSKCAELFEGSAEWSQSFERLDEDVDLCPACFEQLIGWFDGHSVTDLDDYGGSE